MRKKMVDRKEWKRKTWEGRKKRKEKKLYNERKTRQSLEE